MTARPCVCCGKVDARTRLGRFCVGCFSLTTSEQRALQLERQSPESEAVEGYERKAA